MIERQVMFLPQERAVIRMTTILGVLNGRYVIDADCRKQKVTVEEMTLVVEEKKLRALPICRSRISVEENIA